MSIIINEEVLEIMSREISRFSLIRHYNQYNTFNQSEIKAFIQKKLYHRNLSRSLPKKAITPKRVKI